MQEFVPTRARTVAEKLFLERFDAHAAERRDSPALIADENSLSRRDLLHSANGVARALIDAGAKPGDRAAIASFGSIDYIVILLGILKARMSAVPLSTMANAELLVRLLEDSGASFVFADGYAAKMLDGNLPSDCSPIALAAGPPRWLQFQDWVGPPSDEPPGAAPAGGDEFNVIYSSGTTGTPKGIVHDHDLRAVQVNAFEAFGLSPYSTTALTTALYSNYSLVALLATLGAGGSVLLMPKFDELRFLSASREHSVTHAFLVPEQIARLLAYPDFDRLISPDPMTVISAGSPLPANRKRDVIERWPGLLLEIYGATEGGASSVLVANQFPDKLSSVGRPSEGSEIRIVAEDGAEAQTGEPGEIVGRSATMMRGYLGRDEETEALVWRSPEGQVFMRSGDIGYFDADGFLYLSDRKKDVIISGGMNVYAADLEAVLRDHPVVRDCAVVGEASERWGETPVAFVVLGGDAPSLEEICRWTNDRLSKHQRMSRVIAVSDLPRNDMGKVVKKDLRRRVQAARAAPS